jgi:hypothetical protein
MKMDLKKLLQTTPESLALEQYNALLEATVKLLGRLQGHIQRGELEQAGGMLFDSPAGDGHGWDNTCISFGDLLPADGTDRGIDIGDVLNRLRAIKRTIEAVKTADAPGMKRGKQ